MNRCCGCYKNSWSVQERDHLTCCRSAAPASKASGLPKWASPQREERWAPAERKEATFPCSDFQHSLCVDVNAYAWHMWTGLSLMSISFPSCHPPLCSNATLSPAGRLTIASVPEGEVRASRQKERKWFKWIKFWIQGKETLFYTLCKTASSWEYDMPVSPQMCWVFVINSGMWRWVRGGSAAEGKDGLLSASVQGQGRSLPSETLLLSGLLYPTEPNLT